MDWRTHMPLLPWRPMCLLSRGTLSEWLRRGQAKPSTHSLRSAKAWRRGKRCCGQRFASTGLEAHHVRGSGEHRPGQTPQQPPAQILESAAYSQIGTAVAESEPAVAAKPGSKPSAAEMSGQLNEASDLNESRKGKASGSARRNQLS